VVMYHMVGFRRRVDAVSVGFSYHGVLKCTSIEEELKSSVDVAYSNLHTYTQMLL
jgi:hypothetical protein